MVDKKKKNSYRYKKPKFKLKYTDEEVFKQMKQKSALELYEYHLKSLYAEDNMYYLINYHIHYEIYNTLLEVTKVTFELSEKKEYTIHSFKTKKEMDESIEIRNTLQNQSVLFVDASIKDEQGQYAIVKEKELYYR